MQIINVCSTHIIAWLKRHNVKTPPLYTPLNNIDNNDIVVDKDDQCLQE